ncbi:uncharacterized protein [Excalfactoria chinensis]|uniref:uncharacterized protein n=1 Tax=Excalfactoria chinensis TaxID=46218 RepID=UPI003B3A7E6B
MKFYYDFLERISGKEKLEKVVFQAPWLLDMVVSRVAAVASLTSSGRVVVFPRFQREFAPKPPPGKRCKASRVPLPPLGQDKKEESPAFPPLPGWITVTFLVEEQPEETTSDVKRKDSQLPAVPQAPSAKEQPEKQKKAKRSTKSKEPEGKGSPKSKEAEVKHSTKSQEPEGKGSPKSKEAEVKRSTKSKGTAVKRSTKRKEAEMGPAPAAQPPSAKEEEELDFVRVPTIEKVPKKSQAKPRKHSGAPALPQTPLAALWTSSSDTSLPKECTSRAFALMPLRHKGTGWMQSQPAKSKAGLPRRGTSCPL